MQSYQANYYSKGLKLIKSFSLNKERLLVAIRDYIPVEIIGKIELLVNISAQQRKWLVRIAFQKKGRNGVRKHKLFFEMADKATTKDDITENRRGKMTQESGSPSLERETWSFDVYRKTLVEQNKLLLSHFEFFCYNIILLYSGFNQTWHQSAQILQ